MSYSILTDWLEVQHGVKIDYDLENSPIEVKTNSLPGSGDVVGLYLYKDQWTQAGGIVLRFADSPPTFTLNTCTSSQRAYLTELPSGSYKVWKITLSRISGARKLVIHCNDLEVVNILMSDENCGRAEWRDQWSIDVMKISFQTWDSASEGYRTAPG